MASSRSWWAGKVRQFRSHVLARVGSDERAALADWLTPAQLALFDAMNVADRRHGLDVVATLRRDGADDPDLLVAGLLHDAGKGRTGVWPRVAYALGQRYGPWVWRLAGVLPGWRIALARLRDHAETSAALAGAAGCSARTVELIRHQEEPVDDDAGRALLLADEAN
jgi:hypothetical protein